eukprot:COSAG01_NODE_51797_length_352_cov_0.415020_1_plen_87_part_10
MYQPLLQAATDASGRVRRLSLAAVIYRLLHPYSASVRGSEERGGDGSGVARGAAGPRDDVELERQLADGHEEAAEARQLPAGWERAV